MVSQSAYGSPAADHWDARCRRSTSPARHALLLSYVGSQSLVEHAITEKSHRERELAGTQSLRALCGRLPCCGSPLEENYKMAFSSVGSI
jgi:hypothetical protein